MNSINTILDSMNPTDYFIHKNEKIKEALANKANTSRIQRPVVKDVMKVIARR